MPALHDPDRAAVRVAAGDRLRAVHDRDDARSMRPSAATRSRSRWSMTAISPACRRGIRSLVRRSTRAGPWTAKVVGLRLAAQQAGHQRRLFRDGRAGPRRAGRLEQLRGVAAGVGRSRRRPRASATARRRARHRRRSARAPPSARPSCCPRPLVHGLLHHDLRVGERRHLREVRDAEHLVPRAERRSRRPTATPASPPIPASTSSNTSVGGASDSTTRGASIARDSSPPDAALASGRAALPGVGGEQERHPSCAVVGRLPRLDLDLDHRMGHRQLAEVHLDGRGPSGSAAARRAAVSAAAAACAGAALRPRRGGPRVGGRASS